MFDITFCDMYILGTADTMQYNLQIFRSVHVRVSLECRIAELLKCGSEVRN